MIKVPRHIYLILFVLCIGYTAHAQVLVHPYSVAPRRPYSERQTRANPENRIENVKEQFIRQQLQLPPEQARKFFPLYREYQTELFNVRRLKRINNSNDAVNGTDQINKDLFYDSQLVSIKLRFKDAFLKILSPEKLSELYKSEKEFNDELVRSLSERSVRAGN